MLFYWLAVLLVGTSNALHPLIGGHLSWSISHGFMQGDRSVNITLMTTFLASEGCSYEIGQVVACNSTELENTHGILHLQQLTVDSDGNKSSLAGNPTAVVNQFVTVDILYSSEQLLVFGLMQHTVDIAEINDGLLVWFSLGQDADNALLPPCSNSPNHKTCSTSPLFIRKLHLDSYWSGFLSESSSNISYSLSGADLFLSYIRLCSIGGINAMNCTLNPILNFNCPVAWISPIYSVPISDESIDEPQTFHFKSYDDDGDKMTQFVPFDFSMPALTAPCVFPRPDSTGAPLGWQTGLCMGGSRRGMPCTARLASVDCGADIACAPTWSGCREFRDGDPDVASAAGNVLRFNFSFGGSASPFRSGGADPLTREGAAAGCATCSGVSEMSQHAVFTFDYPWTSSSAVPDAWPASPQMPSWRDSSAAVLTLFSVFPNYCGTANRPPAFVRSLRSVNEDVETERSCAFEAACEFVLYARDFALQPMGAPPSQTHDVIRVGLAPGFFGRASLQRTDGSECVGEGSLECIVTVGMPAEAQRVGSSQILCFIATDYPATGTGAKRCTSLPLCLKIRLDAFPLASSVLLELGLPKVTLSEAPDESSTAGLAWKLLLNISWAVFPGNRRNSDRISNYCIEYSVDGGVYARIEKLIGSEESSLVLTDSEFVLKGSHDYSFRVVAFYAKDAATLLSYYSLPSTPVRLFYPQSSFLPTARLLYTIWEGHVFSLFQKGNFSSDSVWMGSFTSAPVVSKNTVIDSDRSLIISFIPGINNDPKLLIMSIKDHSVSRLQNLNIPSTAPLWNLEMDEASEAVIAVCINISHSMIVSIPVPSTADTQSLHSFVLSFLPCPLSFQSPCQVLFSVSAFDRFSRVYYYVDAATRNIMAFSIPLSKFWQLSPFSEDNQVFSMIYDDYRSELCVFTGAWPIKPKRLIHMSRIKPTAPVEIIESYLTSLDPSILMLGSVACDFALEYCLFASQSGTIVKYDIDTNHSFEYPGFPGTSMVDILFYIDRIPILRAVNPCSVNFDVAELTIYGFNFGLRSNRIHARIGNVLCNQTILESDRLLICSTLSLSNSFGRASLSITIQNDNHLEHFENVVYVLGDSWTELLPKTNFISLAFGQQIVFNSNSFLPQTAYRCLFASESHGALCDPPFTVNTTCVTFAMPLWLGIGQETSTYLLSGQEYDGQFRPNRVVPSDSGSITKAFSPSWISVTPRCVNLSLGDHETVIEFFGLGFDPSKVTMCTFSNNGNLSAIYVTTRVILCAISPATSRFMKAGIEHVFPFQWIGDTHDIVFYNKSCLSDLESCMSHSSFPKCCPTIQLNGMWISIKPTIGLIGGGTLITVFGLGFNSVMDIDCYFKAFGQFWSIPSIVQDTEYLICNSSNLKSGRNMLEFTLNTRRITPNEVDCGPCNFSFCHGFLSGPSLTFQFKSYFKGISISSATAAGNLRVTIFGFGFDATSVESYKCSFGGLGDLMQTQAVVFAQSISETYMTCLVPRWQYAASSIHLRIYLFNSDLLSLPEAEFEFEYSQQVDEIKGMQLFILKSATFQVWGSGFHLNQTSYICEISSNQSSGSVIRHNANPINHSLLLCENLTVYSSIVQFRIYFLQPDNSLYLLKSSYFMSESSWTSLAPESISLQGGILTVHGNLFQEASLEYQLSLCYLSRVCPWQNLTAIEVTNQSVIFQLPKKYATPGTAFATLSYRGAIISHVSVTSLSVLPALISLSPTIGCINHSNSIMFAGFGFSGVLLNYMINFKDDSGLFQTNNNCSILQDTLLQCLTSPWPYPAIVEATLIVDCFSENVDYLCSIQQSRVVARFTFTFTVCVTAIEPTRAGAARSRPLYLSGIGFDAAKQYECRFQVPKDIEIISSTVDAPSAITRAEVHSSTLISCLSPVWQWPSAIVNMLLIQDDFDVFSTIGLQLYILPEIVYIEPTKGSQAGRLITVFGAGFSVLYRYICSVFGGDNSTSVIPSDSSMVLCRLPPWKGGNKNSTIILIDVNHDILAVGTVYFNYAEGIKSLSVSVGPASGGTEINVIGEAFDSTIQYQAVFGGLTIVHTTFVNSSNLQIATPIWSFPGSIVEITLSDGTYSLDAGSVSFEYFEVYFSISPPGGLAFGSFLLLRGYGFRQQGSYRCILTSRNVSSHAIATRSTKPKGNQSTEIEFSVPRWKFSGEVLELSVFNEFGIVLSVADTVLTFEVKSAWTSLDYDPATSYVGGTQMTIYGAGFKLNSLYTCQLRACDAAMIKCRTANSSASTVPCDDVNCSRGPYRARDRETIVCFVPAWLYPGNLAFVRVFEGDNLIDQVLAPPPRISLTSAPLIRPGTKGMNAPYWGGSLLNFSGMSYGFVDLSVRSRVGLSSCSSTEWVSNTQIHCMISRASRIETGIPILVSLSQYQIGTAPQHFTYDGPIPLRFVRFDNIDNHTLPVFEKVTNAPGIGTLTALTGFFSYVDLTLKSRFGYSVSQFTNWMSNSILLCKSTAGTGVDLGVALILDAIVVTADLGFIYDEPSLSSNKNSNLMSYHSQFLNSSYVNIFGQNFGLTGNTQMSRLSSYTATENTVWVSDSTICNKASVGNLRTLRVGMTVGANIGSTSEALTYDQFSVRQSGNILNFACTVLGSAQPSLVFMTSSSSTTIGHTASEMSLWSSSTSIFLKSSHGVQGSHGIAVTAGVQVGTNSLFYTYNSPNILFSLSEVAEGLRTTGRFFSKYGIGAQLGFKMCNDTSNAGKCDWKLSYTSQAQIGYGSWIFCISSDLSDNIGIKLTTMNNTRQLKCNDIPDSQSDHNVVLKYSREPTLQQNSVDGATEEIYLVYAGDCLRSSLYPGWQVSLAEFDFIIFPDDQSESPWLGFLFRYADFDNFYSFDMNIVLGIYRMRKKVDGASTHWECDPANVLFAFIPGVIYNLRLEILQTSISVQIRMKGDSYTEYPIWQKLCQMNLNSQTVNFGGSFGFSGSGSGMAFFMNLHIYNPPLIAKHSNLMSTSSKYAMSEGLHFGLTSASVYSRIEHSTCESSFWSSDTVIFSLPANAVGSTVRISITVGSEKGTLSEALSYCMTVISGASAVNGLSRQLRAFSVQNMGLSSISIAANVGISSCETSAWQSTTSVRCKITFGQSSTLQAICTAGNLAGTETDVWSYDSLRFQVLKICNEAVMKGGVATSIFGKNLGKYDQSPNGRIRGTACGQTMWFSDTGLKCLPIATLSATSTTALTVGVRAGTLTAAVSSNTIAASSFRWTNTFLSSSDYVFILGSNLGTAAYSGKMCIGMSAGESSMWTSDSSLKANIAPSISSSLRMHMTANVRIGTCSSALSIDRPAFLSANISFYQGNHASWASISLNSTGLGKAGYTVSSGVGSSQAEKTGWVSETSAFALIPSGVGGSLRVKLTAMSAVGTSEFEVSYLKPEISATLPSSVVTRIYGSWCAVESSSCTCSGIVQFKSVSTFSASYLKSTSAVSCSSPTFVDPAPGMVKTCYCYNWPFAAMQQVTVVGIGFGSDDFTPIVTISATKSPSTSWISDSSILASIPMCTDCGAAVMTDNVVVNVAQQSSSIRTFHITFDFNISTESLCPIFWSNRGTYNLSSSSGMLCRTSTGGIENISWIIDPCLTNNNCVLSQSSDTVFLIQATIYFNLLPSSGSLSVSSCSSIGCESALELFKFSQGLLVPSPISGKPYLKVMWSSNVSASGSSWLATWTSLNNISFRFFLSPVLNFSAAEAACNALPTNGSMWHLASITTAQEEAALESLAAASNQIVWIGLHYNTTGSTVWTDGTPYGARSYSNFIPGFTFANPSNCTAAALNLAKKYWLPQICSVTFSYVCSNKIPSI